MDFIWFVPCMYCICTSFLFFLLYLNDNFSSFWFYHLRFFVFLFRPLWYLILFFHFFLLCAPICFVLFLLFLLSCFIVPGWFLSCLTSWFDQKRLYLIIFCGNKKVFFMRKFTEHFPSEKNVAIILLIWIHLSKSLRKRNTKEKDKMWLVF